MDVLVTQMIHFVEELPMEWQPQRELMKKNGGRAWDELGQACKVEI